MSKDDNEVEVEIIPEEGIEVEIPEEKSERTGKIAPKESSPEIDPDEDDDELQGKSDSDRDAIRARRREERKQRKLKYKERDLAKDHLVASLQQQNTELSDRLARVESRQSGNDFHKLDEELNAAIQTANEAKNHIKNAMKDGDGDTLAEATELHYAARRRAEHLAGIKQNLVNQAKRPKAPVVNPRAAKLTSQWLSANSWFDPNSDDEDSAITKVIDNGVAREGFDPATNEYWEELSARVKERLPGRVGGKGEAAQSRSARRDAPTGSGREGSIIGAADGKFYLSAERVKAIKSAGMWEDEKSRAEMIKNYRSYDRENQKKEKA